MGPTRGTRLVTILSIIPSLVPESIGLVPLLSGWFDTPSHPLLRVQLSQAMKTLLSSAALLLLGGFAFGATGCVTEYHTVSTAPTYSETTLPAASRVALVMEFRGGEPTPEVRADVRALVADYLAGKGSVLVDGPEQADYLVHVVLERRNPDNPDEWTVVNTYSAQSLGVAGGDEYRWPAGLIEDDYYETTSFSYIGFGVFYPMWFDLWDSPWHRGHLILCPPPRPHHRYGEIRWREERRWHRPERWHPERRRDWDRRDDRRPDNRDRRPEVRRDDDRRREQARPADARDRRPDTHRPDLRRGDDRRREQARPGDTPGRRPEGGRPGSDRARRDHGNLPPRPAPGPRPEAGAPGRSVPAVQAPAAQPPVVNRPPAMRPPTRPSTPPPPTVAPDRGARPVAVPGTGVRGTRPAPNPPVVHREAPRVQPPAQANKPSRPAVRATPQPAQNPQVQRPAPRTEPRRVDTRGGEPRKFTPPPQRENSSRDRSGSGRPAPRRNDSEDSDRDKNTPPR